MTQLDGLRRYIEAATTLTQITRGRAEELVRELVASGEVERGRAQDWIEGLVKRSREVSEALMVQVSTEVDRQLGDRGLKNFDLDDLAARVAGIIDLAGTVGRNVTHGHGPTHTSHPNGTSAKATAGTATKKSPKKDKAKPASGKDGAVKAAAKKKTSSTKVKDKAKSAAKGSGEKKVASKKSETAEQPSPSRVSGSDT